ncbi:MAG: gamma-glutamylcyclotransferase [Actinobacteria bacterium]|nr:gamma-glutamylcyclotransferase [Actinomycetota bacterium]
MSTWVFGYGSLVSPVSLGSTIGRLPQRGVDFLAAECRGWERRWNYGYLIDPTRYTGNEVSRIDTVVALGIAPVADAVMNGVIAAVSESELAYLDERERRYEQVDVTSSVALLEGEASNVSIDRVVTYVPTQGPITDYVEARDRGRAGIEIRYWNLVNNAFDELLPGAGDRFRSTTPEPDVPVVDVSRIE